MWRFNDNPVIHINDEQEVILTDIFTKMMKEMDGDYIHKYDLLRNYVQLIVHEALKVKPQDVIFKQNNASVRLTSLFIELLERQFPIGSTEHIFRHFERRVVKPGIYGEGRHPELVSGSYQ